MVARALSLDRFIPYRLSVASNAVSGCIADSYRKRFGLRVPEWRIVAILAEFGPLTQLRLCETGRLDKIAVHRAAAVLIGRGLVAAKRNPKDGRSHFLVLTGEGRLLHADIAPEALAMERRLLAGFSRQEVSTLEMLLRRIEAAASEPNADSEGPFRSQG